MRASRLLRILLLLQNRGRLTAGQLAGELEVAPRTILRDVDAMTEAGLPVIVHRGTGGGIELGFNYRSRLTGLDRDEAEALALILAAPAPQIGALGMTAAAARARAKLVESLPDRSRATIAAAARMFPAVPGPFEAPESSPDPRIAALADAVRRRRIVRLAAKSPAPRLVHPLALSWGPQGWALVDSRSPDAPVPMADWGDVNISALGWEETDQAASKRM